MTSLNSVTVLEEVVLFLRRRPVMRHVLNPLHYARHKSLPCGEEWIVDWRK